MPASPLKCPPTPFTEVEDSNPHMHIPACRDPDKADGGSNPRMCTPSVRANPTLMNIPTKIHTMPMAIQGTHTMPTAPPMLAK